MFCILFIVIERNHFLGLDKTQTEAQKFLHYEKKSAILVKICRQKSAISRVYCIMMKVGILSEKPRFI